MGPLTAAPAASSAPKAAIAARQAGYKKMGAAMKALNDQLKSDAPVKATLVAAAQALATTAREQPKFFPAGSGPAAGVPTDALPNIWTDRANFDAQMAKLIGESGKLVVVANGGNAEAIRVQAKATGATCAACHRQFRADT
ncbi:cytochrome c [Sphingobium sp. BYY-5]|uniref:c-type cytochrome n=1 Tax=Sphingobium sp. BYY-5 TaxID=2926400 RepID=UPI00325A894D